MKALVLKEYNNFSIEDVPVPEVGADDVLIRVKACAICGSDVHGMDGSTGRRIPPIIMGHEGSGIIEKKGANVSEYMIGEKVTFDSTIYCGSCAYCRQGRVNLCDNRRVLGVSCDDYRQNGAFAEYIAVPKHILYKVPDGVSFERAAMVEPLSIAVHAVSRADIAVNDTAVVVGAGMIGLLVIQVLKISGCGKIIAVDIDSNKLDMALSFGAHEIIKSDDVDAVSEIKKITRNRGADIAFEAVGISGTIQTAINSLKKGGQLTLIGNLSPMIDLPLQKVVTGEIAINGSCASAGEYGVCLELIEKGAVDVDAFISRVIPLEEAGDYFHRLYNKEAGLMKVIVKP